MSDTIILSQPAPEKAFDGVYSDVGKVPDDVVELFERFALQIINSGYEHYSARAILHRIRWHMHIERGHRAFKCNDHWTPSLSRWFMARHPEHDGFFETRERKSLGEDEDGGSA